MLSVGIEVAILCRELLSTELRIVQLRAATCEQRHVSHLYSGVRNSR